MANTSNRIPKHLRHLIGIKSSVRSMSNEILEIYAKQYNNKYGNDYVAELERRKRNALKRKTPRPRQ